MAFFSSLLEEERLRRCSTKSHKCYGGIDRHARPMYRCLLNQAGEILLPRTMTAAPAPFLQAIAPYREDRVVGVECLLTWSGLAALGADEGSPFVRGPALELKAIHGGNAKHEAIDAQTIAVLRRGGMRPQAYGDPAKMRATHALRRRRIHRVRPRAALLAHVQQTNSQSNRPAIGNPLADKANRAGVAERFPEPAVQTSIALDLTPIDAYARLVTDLERDLVNPAKAHEAQTFYRLRSIPGVGKRLALVRLDAIHDIHRFPPVQEFGASCRLVKCTKEATGTR